MPVELPGELDEFVEAAISAARIPGAALAVVAGGQILCARAYGYGDRCAHRPMTADSLYPIASTTKAMNATLLGMLVDEQRLAWDAPIQSFLPSFRLGSAAISAQLTVRDLLCMRTGLPRHDWMWLGNPMTRAELVRRVRHLELSAGLRERFQYSNITATIAGHIAEVVRGESWETLVQEKLLAPLGMNATTCTRPTGAGVTLSYHENHRRQLVPSEPLESAVTAPSGGALYSNVKDMAKWMLFNLNRGNTQGCQLVQPGTLAEIHSPQVVARTDASCPSPNAAYCLGWFLDSYNGRSRLTHGGYLDDLVSEVSLFPQDEIGVVSFINFGPPGIARHINVRVFDLMMGFKTAQTLKERLAIYESKVTETRSRTAAVRRVQDTLPSHDLDDYTGTYTHPGYGEIAIRRRGPRLNLHRSTFLIALTHWHYDAWVGEDETGRFGISAEHPFDTTNPLLFETDAAGDIVSLTLQLEPAVSRIRFERRRSPLVMLPRDDQQP